MSDTINFSPERMDEWDRHYEQRPRYRRMRDLIVEYAEEQGGLTLEFWKLRRGHWFGLPFIVGGEDISRSLGVPTSDLETIWKETGDWLRPRLAADPEFADLGG